MERLQGLGVLLGPDQGLPQVEMNLPAIGHEFRGPPQMVYRLGSPTTPQGRNPHPKPGLRVIGMACQDHAKVRLGHLRPTIRNVQCRAGNPRFPVVRFPRHDPVQLIQRLAAVAVRLEAGGKPKAAELVVRIVGERRPKDMQGVEPAAQTHQLLGALQGARIGRGSGGQMGHRDVARPGVQRPSLVSRHLQQVALERERHGAIEVRSRAEPGRAVVVEETHEPEDNAAPPWGPPCFPDRNAPSFPDLWKNS